MEEPVIASPWLGRGTTALMLAAAIQDDDTFVTALCDAGASVDIVDKLNGESALFYAVRAGSVPCIRRLAGALGASMTLKNKQGETVLHAAASGGHVAALTALLSVSSAPEVAFSRDDFGNTPLILAARFGHTACVHALIQAARGDRSLLDAQSTRGMTAVMAAAFWNHIGALRLLHAAAASMDLVDCNGMDVVAMAIWRNSTGTLEFLLNGVGLKVDGRGEMGMTPLCMATWNGSTDCALMLAAACPRVINDADVGGNTPLHHAVRTSKLPLVTAFLQQYGADPGRRNAEGATPLHFAAECKDPRCLEVLLKSCPPISARVTASGFTPLLSAVSRGRILCTLALLDAGASPMECSKQGHTALEVAAQSGRIELVKVLAPRVKATGLIGGAPAIQAAALAFRSALCCAALADAPDIMSWLIHEAGVPPDAIDPLGRYPLHCAAASGSLRGISILMEECFVSPDRVDAATLTPLLTAATAGYLDAVKLLIHHGASISAKTSEGDTLCLCAVRSGNVALVRYLVGELNLGRRDKDNSGADLMMTAADSGNLPMIQMLSKEFGFSVNTMDQHGNTPLSVSIQRSRDKFGSIFDGSHAGVAAMGAVMKDALNVLHGDVATFGGMPAEVMPSLAPPPEGASNDPMGPTFLTAVAQNKADLVRQIGSARPLALCAIDPETGRNALGVAVSCGAVDVVRLLLETFQFAPKDPEMGHDTVMHAAAATKSLSMLQYLVSYPPTRALIDVKCTSTGQTPLFVACREGSFEYAISLIQTFRCDVNTVDNTGATLLHAACQSGNAELVEYLIRSCSLSTHDVDGDGRVPLFYACRAGDASVVKAILTWGKAGLAPMALVECVGVAAQRNFPVLAGLLISDLGVEVDCRLTSTCKGVATDRHSNSGYTPFMLACMSGASSSVSFLHKQYHADPSLTNSVTGENTLHLAVSHGHWEVLVYLLEECEQDPRYRLLNGSTLLTAAMAHDSTKSDPSLPMVSLVTKLVPDSILLFNDTAVSALHLAAFQGRDRILDHFITTCGVDVNTRAANGHTPLMAAARAGKVGTVILLGGKLSADLYATAATPDGDVTARDIASRFGHAQVVAMLDLLSEKRRWKVAMLCIRSLQAGFVGVERGLAAMGLDLPPPSCEGIVELFLDRRMSLSGGLRGKTIISPFARRMISFL